jgi:choline dehydrogenase-like flavoprotein
MSTSSTPQRTDFSLDLLGRFLCNGLDEALQSTDKSKYPDARLFDVIVAGAGSFGSILAAHLFNSDKTHSHRILVLDGGPFLLPEHAQNLPMVGITAPPPEQNDPGVPREFVWGLPWQTSVKGGFPGLAYCLGGRSVFWGGWSPQLLPAEMPTAATPQQPNPWPVQVVNDLTKALPNGDPGYFRQAAEQIGTTKTNDFIHGPLHTALRRQLYEGVKAGQIKDAVPFAEIPQVLDGVPPGKEDLFKLEAPLAVEGSPPRSGFFPINKFSAVPLLAQAARSAREESVQSFPSGDGADVRKRLMVVPNCHVTRLITDVASGQAHVTGVLTNQGFIPLPAAGVAVLALGTIESARVALLSFGGITGYPLIGTNLMAHLRSNMAIRVPRSALSFLPADAKDLEQSALFLKGRHQHADGSVGHFHLQITASSGGGGLGTNSDAELFQKIPDIDLQKPFRAADLDHVVITLRSIGETQPQNPKNRITLKLDAIDEVGVPRAFVEIGDPREPEQPTDTQQTKNDRDLWAAMDKAAEEVAKVFNGGTMPEVLSNARDGMGTTHHEAGPLWMGLDPAKSVTRPDGRFHFVDNAYVAGPALFPTVGSPNPMLTGTGLARRTADQLLASLPHPVAPAPEAGFTYLFDGTTGTFKQWQRAGTTSTFILADGAIVAYPSGEYAVLVYAPKGFTNFILRLQFRLDAPNDNSGVFVRSRYPFKSWPDLAAIPEVQKNRARVAQYTGYEVQIDDLGRPDNADKHRTGAIYDVEIGGGPGQQIYQRPPVLPAGQWHDYEVEVTGDLYKVRLNGQPTATFTNTDPKRGRPAKEDPFFGFLGVQAHTGLTAFRNIRIKEL